MKEIFIVDKNAAVIRNRNIADLHHGAVAGLLHTIYPDKPHFIEMVHEEILASIETPKLARKLRDQNSSLDPEPIPHNREAILYAPPEGSLEERGHRDAVAKEKGASRYSIRNEHNSPWDSRRYLSGNIILARPITLRV